VEAGIVGSVAASVLKLPLTFLRAQSQRSLSWGITLPLLLIQRLLELLSYKSSEGPLWLDTPPGLLGMMPWEQLLRPALPPRVAVVRPIPDSTGVPSPATHVVAICVSCLDDEQRVGALPDIVVSLIENDPSAGVTFRIFADPWLRGPLWSRLAGIEANVDIVPPPPEEVWRQMGTSDRVGKASEVGSLLEWRWLVWMLRELGGVGVDQVYFIAHGYLSSEEGFLALADKAEDSRGQHLSSFVEAGQLTLLLRALRAKGVALVMPPENYSDFGSRLLADTLARSLLVPVVVFKAASSEVPAWASGLVWLGKLLVPRSVREAIAKAYEGLRDVMRAYGTTLYLPTKLSSRLGGWRDNLPTMSLVLRQFSEVVSGTADPVSKAAWQSTMNELQESLLRQQEAPLRTAGRLGPWSS
jgi:hypothetical protein